MFLSLFNLKAVILAQVVYDQKVQYLFEKMSYFFLFDPHERIPIPKISHQPSKGEQPALKNMDFFSN
jgi:hypothetical protein